ncbi:MAG: alanine--tRNA ligase [Candidatus Verstraetearchaeota archaeon]|nr:alanine--tRNA ligase [Candidatus Verstraetearchaeota archaeon]
MINEEVYRLNFFIENGFIRKECKSCKRHFWTVDPDKELCGDSPCVPYNFIKNPPTRRAYNINEMREEFLSFFERKGHKRIKRYPVIARWRDDIFFTIASIACFQPHVTSGEVPPPYNPLVISQPCIRTTDIGNVGKTGGRHLTIFEMMAHHAFSSKEKEVYWKEETVAYHHEFLTKQLGIPDEEITYIEHWWEGGGDAGPDLEGIVRGLELSTLVFMEYRKVGNTYEKLPLRIVDTGYGLERFTWISKGTPTAFEAIYGDFFDKFLKKLNLEKPDEKIMCELMKFSGMVDVADSKSLMEYKLKVSKSLGIDIESLEKIIRPMEIAMALLDHTKTIIFMLGDGLVPSNVQAGYFGRFFIRRIKRLLDILKVSIPISELLYMQILYWKDQFPEIMEKSDYILHVAELEVSRYEKAIEQGKSLIVRLIKNEEIQKKASIPIDTLLKLYDSHGLPPEIVKEIVEPYGIKVEIPEAFDAMISALHSSMSIRKYEEEDILKGIPSNLPPTELVFYSNPEAKSIRAKVLYSDNNRVVLDRTIFYPEGGGQLSDTGVIIDNGKEVKVLNVKKSRGIVVHFVDKPIEIGKEVECVIDWERRKILSKHHSATHILIGAARRVLGDHVWQHGAQKDVNKSRLDITHFEKISDKQLREIENLANKVIQECRPIRVYFEDRNIAEQKFGFRIYQGGVIPGQKIRIVEIDNWDIEACGGTHCSNTGEIGLIKIIRTERIQDGVERLEFIAGEQAIKYIQSQEDLLNDLSKILNTPIEHLKKTTINLVEELSKLRKSIESLREKIAELLYLNIKPEFINEFQLYYGVFDISYEELLKLASHIVKRNNMSIVILISKLDGTVISMIGSEVMKKEISAGKIVSNFVSIFGGKGGGKQDLGQGKIPLSKIQEIDFHKVKDFINNMVIK